VLRLSIVLASIVAAGDAAAAPTIVAYRVPAVCFESTVRVK
jgi:hypothetical protein